MEPRFQPFHFIDSFRTLCPPKDIETCADEADNHIMDGFCLFQEPPTRAASSPRGDLRALACVRELQTV